jgi:MFS family permease
MTIAEAAFTDPDAVESRHGLAVGTLVAATLGGCVAQIALGVPGVLNGLFQSDLGPSSSQLTWISDAFLVPVTLLELTFGVLGDMFGRKRLLIGGALLVALGELLSILTPGAGTATGTRVMVLWIGQAIAGIGAAALFPTTLAMVAAGARTVRERARSISIWAMALPIGGLTSAVLGGLVAKIDFGDDPTGSWRWALIVVLALAVVSVVVSIPLARDSSAPQGRSLDLPGQILIALALFALLFAVIQSPTNGWGSAEIVVALVAALVFFSLFVLVENRTTAPLLRLDLFRNRAFAIAAVVTVVAMFSYLGTGYTTSIRIAVIQGGSPLRTALGMIPLTLPAILLAPLNARLLARYNPKWALGVGAGLIGVGNLWLATISATDRSIGAIVAPLVLIGLGFGLAAASVTAVTVNTVPGRLVGMASGTTSMLRDFGFTLGPAIIGAMALSRAAAGIQHRLDTSPTLRQALDTFSGSAAHVPAAQRSAVQSAIEGVHSGPLGAVSVPSTVPGPGGHPIPFNPIKDVAFHSLDSAYSLGYLLCGIGGLVAAVLTIAALGGRRRETLVSRESLADTGDAAANPA